MELAAAAAATTAAAAAAAAAASTADAADDGGGNSLYNTQRPSRYIKIYYLVYACVCARKRPLMLNVMERGGMCAISGFILASVIRTARVRACLFVCAA